MRKIIKTFVCLLLLLGLLSVPSLAKSKKNWVVSWGTAPTEINYDFSEDFGISAFGANLTFRIRLVNNLDGEQVRLRFSNLFGKSPIQICKCAIALSGEDGSSIIKGSSVVASFGGKQSASIPAGGSLTTDPIDFSVKAGQSVSVSFYTPYFLELDTGSIIGAETYVSVGPNVTATNQVALPLFTNHLANEEIQVIPLLCGMDVMSDGYAIVITGDSTLTNTAFTIFNDVLRRAGINNKSVLCTAVSGNRLLTEWEDMDVGSIFGDRFLKRMDRDLIQLPGVKYALIRVGGNDINHAALVSRQGITPKPTAKQLTDGLAKVEKACKAKGITPIFLPYTGYAAYERTKDGKRDCFWSMDTQVLVDAINKWSNARNKANGVPKIDLSSLDDPARKYFLNPAYTTDGAHLNWLGQQKFVDLIPLSAVGINVKKRPIANLSPRYSLWDKVGLFLQGES
ncbi:MAG: hypothetical protein LBR73_03080 [Oscillospiraceae bacterium]|jgi:lysophospholipase L1-like esterase|nr:hypothetical protein [Oscillospiraceae bacterium]